MTLASFAGIPKDVSNKKDVFYKFLFWLVAKDFFHRYWFLREILKKISRILIHENE